MYMVYLVCVCHYWYFLNINFGVIIIKEESAMDIPQKYFKNDTFSRNITNNVMEGTLSCGFLRKCDYNYHPLKLKFNFYGGVLVLNGNGTYIDATGKQTPLTPGCYIQRMPEVEHITIADPSSNWLEFYICFGATVYNSLVNLGLLNNVPILNPGITPVIFNTCLHLAGCFKHYPEYKKSQLLLYTLDFAMTIFQLSKQGLVNSNSHQQMKKACELLCDKTNTYQSPHDIAAALGLSYETFRKKFHTTYNTSPTAFQLDYKINKSKTLLEDTDMSLNEIALIFGFADAFSYSKAFKKRCGISPYEYRKLQFMY